MRFHRLRLAAGLLGARSLCLFSLSQRFARIFTYVLIAPIAIAPAMAQKNSGGTCTAPIWPPHFELSIFAYALLAGAVLHFVLLPLQAAVVARFSKAG